MNIFNTLLQTGSYRTLQGEALTRVGTCNFDRTKKGYALNCVGSNYIRSSNINGTLNTIVLEFYLHDEVTATSPYNCMMGYGIGPYPFMSFGSYSASLTNETFTYATYTGNATYIRNNIPKGWNQIILRWNGTSYDIFLNGIQVTTYQWTTHAILRTSSIYTIGCRGDGALYFTGLILDCVIDNQPYTSVQIGKAYNKFLKKMNIFPPIRSFDTLVSGVPTHTVGMPYLDERFKGNAADGKTINAPMLWKSGTSTVKVEEDADGKYMECVTTGTISINIGTSDTSKRMRFSYFNGYTWKDVDNTIASIVSLHPWITIIDSMLSFDFVNIGDKLRYLLITD